MRHSARILAMSAVAGAAVVSGAAATSHAAIIPSWRINPISSLAVTANPALAGAASVSLMVELTDGTLFSSAGLDLESVLPPFAPEYFSQPFGSSFNRPSFGLRPLFPDLVYDTFVATTNEAQAAASGGRLNGAGPAIIGTDTPGQAGFNVLWQAIPNTGNPGPIEIARITLLAGSGATTDGLTPIPLTSGRVSANTGGPVALPPIPLVVPEPAAGVVLAVMTAAVCRRARRHVD